MKPTVFFWGWCLTVLAGSLPAQSAPPPAAANTPVVPVDSFTLLAEGTIPLDVVFKLEAAGPTGKIVGDGLAGYKAPNDAKLHLEGTLTAVKDSYRLDYTLTLRVPIVVNPTDAAANPRMPVSAPVEVISIKSSAILQPGQPLVVANTNGKTITMTLAKATFK